MTDPRGGDVTPSTDTDAGDASVDERPVRPGAAIQASANSATRGRPVYLARAGYRSRRVMDAARLLPVTGMFLLIVPMLWQPPDTGIPATARQAEYLFGIWAALVLVAAILSRKLSRIMRDADAPED